MPAILARMIAEPAWSWTRWVSRISTSSKPAASSSRSNSSSVSAPAMQPVHCAMSRRVASSMSGSATMSVTAKRPPGRSTRAASRKTDGLSAERLITQLEMIDVDRVVRQRHVLDRALQELDVLDPGLALVSAGQLEHLVGHVEAVGLAGRADSPGGEQDVDAAARAEIEDRLALVELGDRRRVAAAERGELGRVRERVAIGRLDRGRSRTSSPPTCVRDVDAAAAASPGSTSAAVGRVRNRRRAPSPHRVRRGRA